MMLRAASCDDLAIILSWISTAESLKLWGGPVLTFPPEAARTWGEIGAEDSNSFVLVEEQNRILGFGQTLQREANAIHLARIILAPDTRGKGLGRVLCEKLMQTAKERHRPAKLTLNVYQDNTVAVSLYQSLGFVLVAEHKIQDSYSMVFACGADSTDH
jgi:ribosomal-protein-alanine N-acetyltransferase